MLFIIYLKKSFVNNLSEISVRILLNSPENFRPNFLENPKGKRHFSICSLLTVRFQGLVTKERKGMKLRGHPLFQESALL